MKAEMCTLLLVQEEVVELLISLPWHGGVMSDEKRSKSKRREGLNERNDEQIVQLRRQNVVRMAVILKRLKKQKRMTHRQNPIRIRKPNKTAVAIGTWLGTG